MSDLISRQAILDMLEDINNHINEGCKYRHDWCVEWVKGLPSIDAVKHGRWIPVDWAEPRRYGCSECHRMVWQLENYCPNCGARMDERKES